MCGRQKISALCGVVLAGLICCVALATSPAIAPDNAGWLVRVATLYGHAGCVHDVAFSHDGRLLASSAYDQTVRLWDVASGQELHSFVKPSNVAFLNSLSFSPDGHLLASSHGVWDLGTFSLAVGVPLQTMHVAFSPDGDLLAVGAEMRPICLMDTATWKVIRSVESLQSVHWTADDSFGFEFSSDGALLAFGALQSGFVRVFDVASGRLVQTLHYSTAGAVDAHVDVHDVAFSPDGSMLAAGGTAPWVRVFRMPDGEISRTLMTGEGTMSLDFSPDGRVLAVSNEGVVSLWDVETERRLRALSQASAAMAVTFSYDGRLLACGLYDGTITLWRVPE